MPAYLFKYFTWQHSDISLFDLLLAMNLLVIKKPQCWCRLRGLYPNTFHRIVKGTDKVFLQYFVIIVLIYITMLHIKDTLGCFTFDVHMQTLVVSLLWLQLWWLFTFLVNVNYSLRDRVESYKMRNFLLAAVLWLPPSISILGLYVFVLDSHLKPEQFE